MVGRQQPKRSAAGSGRGTGLSAAGWALLMAVCALAITGGVTVLTRLLPPGGTAPAEPVAATSPGVLTASGGSAVVDPASTPASTPAPAPVPAPRTAALEQLTGTWTGIAASGARSFPLTLVVTSSCTEGHACGTLTTDRSACVGNVVLMRVSDGPVFDFAVPSYAPGSSSACEPRAGGDLFVLVEDVLAYRTEHGDGASGRLGRVR
jgi:hypothetical protein